VRPRGVGQAQVKMLGQEGFQVSHVGGGNFAEYMCCGMLPQGSKQGKGQRVQLEGLTMSCLGVDYLEDGALHEVHCGNEVALWLLREC
jgi:hypothetical protein